MNRTDFDAFHDSANRLLQGLGTLEQLLQPGTNGSSPQRAGWKQLAEAGWFRLLLAEEFGGMGLDVQALGAIFLAVGARPVRGPLLDHTVTLPLLRGKVVGPCADRLDAALDGDVLLAVAQALSEPYGAGAQGLQLRAGSLHGTAELVAFGPWADAFVVVAHENEEPVLILLDAALAQRMPCVGVDPCADYARVAFADVPVASTDVLLRGPEAKRLLQHSTAIQRLAAAAEMCGCTSEMMRMSLEYAGTRKQFGRPIGSFQALQHLLADMASQSGSLSSLLHISLADACDSPERLQELGMIAKAYACTIGRQLGQDALQVHGGIGFTAELPLHLYMRRILTYQGMLGESDALLLGLGEQALREVQAA